MSNIGKQYIQVPKGIIITLNNNEMIVQGNKGILKKKIPNNIIIIYKNSKIYLFPNENSKKNENIANWGTMRAIIKNMIKGVHQGFNVKLQLVGIGYKVNIENNILTFKLGFSHLINYEIPKDIKIQIIKPTLLSIQGIDHEFVTSIAAQLRSFRKPEPYKGKGIRYTNEHIIKKEGKKK